LTTLERQIAEKHPSAHSLVAEDFERLVGTGKVLLLDVREQAEFEISRIPGAERVEPDVTADALIARFADRLTGRAVLLYCSVGVRSSALAERVDAAVKARGAVGAYNLGGGVFAWHNTGRQLVDVAGATSAVHGYDRSWSRYLDFSNLATLQWPWRWRWPWQSTSN
jgi:rhodanese-related sulfurtransferase